MTYQDNFYLAMITKVADCEEMWSRSEVFDLDKKEYRIVPNKWMEKCEKSQ